MRERLGHEEVQSERDLYTFVAKRQGDAVKPYIDVVNQVRSDIYEQRVSRLSFDSPFISVIGPCGSGKTQLVYSLHQNGCKCIHLVMDTSENTQIIHQVNLDFSRAFKDCIKADLKLMETLKDVKDVQEEIMECSFLKKFENAKMKTIGFMHGLLSHDEPEAEEIVYSSMSFKDFSANWDAVWCSPPRDNHTPCICIDEFSLNEDDKLIDLFARNAIRALGLVCITIGHSPSAADLQVPMASSYASSIGPSFPCVYIVHRLPKTDFQHTPPDTIELYNQAVSIYRSDVNWRKLFEWIESAPTCRPRFFRHALDGLISYLNDGTDKKTPELALQAILDNIRTKFIRLKEVGNWGLSGQILSLLPRPKPGNLSSSFIQCYFADMYCPSSKEIYFKLYKRVKCEADKMNQVLEDKDGESWDPHGAIPTMAMEQLGTLALLVSGSGNVLVRRSSLSRSFFLNYREKIFPGLNIPESERDRARDIDLAFKNFVLLAFIISSAESKTKFHGTRLDLACSAVLANLSLSEKKEDPFGIETDCELKLFLDRLGDEGPLLPLLGPVNENYEFLLDVVDPTFRNGTLQLNSDEESCVGCIIDSNSTWCMFVEVNLQSSSLTNCDIIEIVRKVLLHEELGQKQVIFIVTKDAKLDLESLSTDCAKELPSYQEQEFAFFQCSKLLRFEPQISIYGNLKFKASESFASVSVEQAASFKTIVIVLSLEEIYSGYNIDKHLRMATVEKSLKRTASKNAKPRKATKLL